MKWLRVIERVAGRNGRLHIEHPVVHAVGDEEHVGGLLSLGNHADPDAFRQRDDLDGPAIKQSLEPLDDADHHPGLSAPATTADSGQRSRTSK